MRNVILIDIDDKSLELAGISRRDILDQALVEVSNLFNRHNLDFDCGYDPQWTTNSIKN